MNIRFWGVRGSIAVSGQQFHRTGGNTTCVEIEHEGERIVLDGGTGLAALGSTLALPTRLTLLFTHVHWDHIQGVPFFTPLFHPGSEVTMMGHATQWGDLRASLDAQMQPPSFPVGLDAFRADLRFRDIAPNAPFEVGPFRITGEAGEHPNGVMAYRIEAGGKSVVFATDIEHGDAIDRRLVRLSEGADLLIHDAQYTTEEYRGCHGGMSRKGWGHSAIGQAIEVADRAEVGRLALFHHDPTRTDDQVAVLEADAADRRQGTFAAREGGVLPL